MHQCIFVHIFKRSEKHHSFDVNANYNTIQISFIFYSIGCNPDKIQNSIPCLTLIAKRFIHKLFHINLVDKTLLFSPNSLIQSIKMDSEMQVCVFGLFNVSFMQFCYRTCCGCKSHHANRVINL